MLTGALQPRQGAGFTEEKTCQPLSASIKQRAGERELISLVTTGRLQGSELLPCFLTAMKIGFCIEPESLASQSLAGFETWQLLHWESKNFKPLPSPPSLIPQGVEQRGYSPSQCWPCCKAHPQAPIPSGFHRLLPNSGSWSQRNVEQSLEFFFCQETSTFEFRIPFRPPEQAHCKSLQSHGLPQQTWRGLFPVYILLLLAGV